MGNREYFKKMYLISMKNTRAVFHHSGQTFVQTAIASLFSNKNQKIELNLNNSVTVTTKGDRNLREWQNTDKRGDHT